MINKDSVFSLTIVLTEIEWILYQLQAPSTRLYPYLFTDESADKIRQLLDMARDSLLKRGWIEAQSGDNVTLDMTVAGIVGTLGFAKVALFVNLFREQDTKPQVRRYFSAEGLLVEQAADSTGEVTLTALRDLKTLGERLNEYLGLKDQAAPRKGVFQCDAAAFADIPYILAGDGDAAAITQLVHMGADDRFAADLVGAMANPLWQATLQVVALDAEQPEGVRVVDQLMVLEGIYGLWLIHTVPQKGQNVLEVKPCSAAQARERLGDMVQYLSS